MINIDKKVILPALFILSLLANVFLAGSYLALKSDSSKAREAAERGQKTKKIAEFGNLFVQKVLKSEKDVDFEERLILETTVRDLNDEEIILQWQKFTESQTKEDAQREVKNLLELLLKKIAS